MILEHPTSLLARDDFDEMYSLSMDKISSSNGSKTREVRRFIFVLTQYWVYDTVGNEYQKIHG
jgi:hypothetical protein